MTLSKSPSSGSFRKQNAINKPNADELFDLFSSMEQQKLNLEETDEWKKDNMEYDLRSTQWILEKVKADKVYAQHLYASMCNREFVKNDVWPILTEKKWSCSWRYAGEIIANMREEGDYVNWYCSGIVGTADPIEQEVWNTLTLDQQKHVKDKQAFEPEGKVTDEIRKDLLKLGWIVVDDNSQD